MAKSERLKGSRSPAPPKITIGDGSVRDLAYWLMGGDVTVKRGKKKANSNTVREEFRETIPTILKEYSGKYSPEMTEMRSKIRSNTERYGPAYNPLTDYTGKYSPSRNDNLSPYTSSRINRSISQGPRPSYGPVQSVPLMEPNYERRKAIPDQKVEDFGGLYQNPDAYAGDPEFDYDIMMTPPGGGMAYGGMVSAPKKRKKKRMYGGKMKKYAKGGGIRKPKYS